MHELVPRSGVDIDRQGSVPVQCKSPNTSLRSRDRACSLLAKEHKCPFVFCSNASHQLAQHLEIEHIRTRIRSLLGILPYLPTLRIVFIDKAWINIDWLTDTIKCKYIVSPRRRKERWRKENRQWIQERTKMIWNITADRSDALKSRLYLPQIEAGYSDLRSWRRRRENLQENTPRPLSDEVLTFICACAILSANWFSFSFFCTKHIFVQVICVLFLRLYDMYSLADLLLFSTHGTTSLLRQSSNNSWWVFRMTFWFLWMSLDGDDMVVGSKSGILDDGKRKRAVVCLV